MARGPAIFKLTPTLKRLIDPELKEYGDGTVSANNADAIQEAVRKIVKKTEMKDKEKVTRVESVRLYHSCFSHSNMSLA